MFSSKRSSGQNYRLISNSENGDELETESQGQSAYPVSSPIWKRRSSLILLLCGSVIFLLGFSFARNVAIQKAPVPKIWSISQSNPLASCVQPSIRREWRTLSRSDQSQYIAAIQCLRNTPSQLGLNQTLYDDFPWTHSRIGNYSHGAAPFLSWHRYLIHVYELTLKNQCGYNGSLVYWDWSLDWEDLTQSPVWDSDTGFGGNGNSSDEESVAFGHCVTDGPFARLIALIWGAEHKPHCLSRGFASPEIVKRYGLKVKPEALKKLLEEPNFESFNLGLETGPHDAIPGTVRGDFLMFTAPYDPIFYLHHTALDRMWWLWQQTDPSQRLMNYGGKAAANSTETAALTDMLHVSSLAPSVTVSEIMSTESDLLCYRY